MKCIYCKSPASHEMKNGKWICMPSPNQCPARKKKNSFSQKGRKRTWDTGTEFKKGNVPWNKGTAKHIIKGSHGGYRKGSGRGKAGWYSGIYCDSSWELAYVIYCLEHDIDIKRNEERRKYIWNNKVRTYIPDFKIKEDTIEIKGYITDQWLAKKQYNPDIKVLYKDDLKEVFEYVISKYGKNYISLYE